MSDPRSPLQHSVFISYAHEDLPYLAQLRKYLKHVGHVLKCPVLWDDTELRWGDPWRQKIDQVLEQARFAVVLVSKDFLASDFIRNVELPRLLQRMQAQHLRILPVLVGPVDIEDSGVGDIQIVNPERPLAKLKVADRDVIYVEISKQVKVALKAVAAANDESLAAAAAAPTNKAPDALTPLADGTQQDLPEMAEWAASLPARLAQDQIEDQLLRLKRLTRQVGFAVFDCDGYYVQFYYRTEIDDASVVMEVASNAALAERGSPSLSKLSIRALTQDLGFEQPDPAGNYVKFPPFRDADDIAELARLSWELLTVHFPSREGAPLSITAQCR